MGKFQDNKQLVGKYYEELDAAAGNDINRVLGRYTSDDYLWRGMHPFYEQQGADDVAEIFWKPFRRSFAPVQRRMDVFMAGKNDIDGGRTEWVCSMGHLMGLFDEDWLGIPSTGKMGFLRYVEFNRITAGKISETALFCDIISVMKQAGLEPLPVQTGAFIITPGPRTHDGLLYEPQDPDESARTLNLINRMIDDLVGSDLESPQDELAETWHDDMIWFGPAGIGATFTRERYQEQHQGPFGAGLDDIRFNGHICRFAEGKYGGFFGWSNLTMRPCGGFMGLPATDKDVHMRVVDIYRRDGDKLAENWIFIDLLYFLMQQGIDVLKRNRRILRR
jgi:predicted ester cyclase